MILLTSVTDKITCTTSVSVAIHFHASWIDRDNTTGVITPGRKNTLVSVASTFDVVPVPAAGVTRNVKTMTVHAQGGSNTISIIHTDGTTAVEMLDAPLAVDEGALYNEGDGFTVCDSNGAIKNVGVNAPGRYLRTVVYATGAANHTTGSQCNTIKVSMVGGGGGGGGVPTATTSAAVGGGGGSGAYLERSISVNPSTTYAYSIGAAGLAGANTGGNGGNGGNTTLIIAATTLTAGGGVGGTGGVAGTTSIQVNPGVGGTPTNGDLGVTGTTGGRGYRSSGTVGQSGAGADSLLGGGGGAIYAAVAGSNATGYGAGGSGGVVVNGSAAVVGGTGSGGLISIAEYT
jgi:hypothetical protein